MHISADDLVDVLRSEGLRITNPRRLVCTVIAERHSDHLTAAAIFDAVSTRSDGDLDIATVYRTLDVLEQAGAIKHGHIGHGPTVYHLAYEADHQHLVCSSCGSTVSIPTRDLRSFIDVITERTGFVPQVEHFALSGLCADCAKKSTTE
ncbi:MAG: transcriptional repressor [Armatimonadetes bacterium]|nr:MAG: transcriptional repressor [Armatimonadota bacterium]